MAQGSRNQRAGSDFENFVLESCNAYYSTGLAWIDKMANPTRPTHIKDPVTNAPLYRLSGKPCYDFFGFYLQGAVMIGAESKTTSVNEPSMPIVGPDFKGSGLMYHQLESLANLARAGGTARVLWDNGGDYLMLREPQIILAHEIYLQAYKAELNKKPAPRGSKSIRAASFEVVGVRALGGLMALDWLTAPQSLP